MSDDSDNTKASYNKLGKKMKHKWSLLGKTTAGQKHSWNEKY
jgi:hypothetical protein